MKAVIFDLDGTVLDTVGSIAYFCNEALKKFGLKAFPEENYKYFAGDGAKNLIIRALSAQNADVEENFDKVFEYYMKSYDGNSAFNTRHFDGMVETLNKLKKRGIKLAIASNKPVSTVKFVLPKFFEENFFDEVYGGGMGFPLKPNPACVEEIIKKFGVDKKEVLYVGDTGTDMQTGKNAGLKTIGVLWGFRGREELENFGADVIISHPSELLDLI